MKLFKGFLRCPGKIQAQVHIHVTGIAEPAPAQIGGCAQSQSQIGYLCPVADVMPALMARLCIVGDFVTSVSLFPKECPGQVIYPVFRVLIRKGRKRHGSSLALPVTVPERSPLLDDKAVGRYVLRFQHGYFFQGILKGFQGLSRNTAHQVYVNVREAHHPGALVAFQEFLKGVYPSQVPKLLVVRGLQADAQPVDPCFPVNMEFVMKQGSRVHLNGDFRVRCHVKMIFERAHDIRYQTWLHDRRSASPYEYGCYLVFTAKGALRFYLPYQLCAIRLMDRFRRPKGQEITVKAFPGAKGYMDVQLHGLFISACHNMVFSSVLYEGRLNALQKIVTAFITLVITPAIHGTITLHPALTRS